MSPLTPPDLYWLAGIIDGEGWFTRAPGGSITIGVTMTDRDIIERVATLFGANITLAKPPAAHPTRKVGYRVAKGGVAGVGWAMTLYRLLSQRRQARIRELLAHWQCRPVANRFRHACPCGRPYVTKISRRRDRYRERECPVCRNAWHRAYGARKRRSQGVPARIFRMKFRATPDQPQLFA